MGIKRHEVGDRIGKLEIIQRLDSDSSRRVRWLCRCECGQEIIRLDKTLRQRGSSKTSCSTCRSDDITSQRFARLLVLCRGSKRSCLTGSSRRNIRMLCLCDCGKASFVTRYNLVHGCSTSCGCYRKESVSKMKSVHGRSRHPLYFVWFNMIARCEDPDNPSFGLYFGKGRGICEQWRNSLTDFINWSLENGWRKGLVIDREDNSLGYSPDNCRYVTPQVNTHNSDVQRRNKTGYAGVWYDSKRGKFHSSVSGIDVAKNRGKKHIGSFFTAEQAVTARNNYIKKHNLPHQIQEIKE